MKSFIRFSLDGMKICEKFLNFHDYCINKNTFHKRKKPVDAQKIDTRKIIISIKYSYGKKKNHLLDAQLILV